MCSCRFVCAHFAPHPGSKNIALRIENYRRLASHLVFPLHPPIPRIQPIDSQINASSHLFLLGDLNFRLEGLGSLAGAPGPLPESAELRNFISDRAAIDGSLVQGSKGQTPWGDLQKWDSLAVLIKQGKCAGGFDEAAVGAFAPTYKFEIGQVGVYRSVSHLVLLSFLGERLYLVYYWTCADTDSSRALTVRSGCQRTRTGSCTRPGRLLRRPC